MSGGGDEKKNGALALLGEETNRSVREPKKGPRVVDFMGLVEYPDEPHRRTIAHVQPQTDPDDATCVVTRASLTIHGANPIPSEDAERDVSIYYKTKDVANLLVHVHTALPGLCVPVDDVETDHTWAMAILRHYVLAHVALEVPDLRRTGRCTLSQLAQTLEPCPEAHPTASVVCTRWKASSSKHEGNTVYRELDALWDVQRFAVPLH